VTKQSRIPPSFATFFSSRTAIVRYYRRRFFKYKPSGEMRARLVVTELLRHPTPELTCALGELCARLVITEQLRRPRPELPCNLKDAFALRAWEYGGYCGVPIPEQSHMPYDGVAMFAQC